MAVEGQDGPSACGHRPAERLDGAHGLRLARFGRDVFGKQATQVLGC